MASIRTEAGSEAPLLPDPLVEEPASKQWCDLVLTGGVASGVVYPWAILELARKFRFRNIGGTSVGAMAAAAAAACEYGRRTGKPHAFEVLRQMPKDLAEEVQAPDGRGNVTKMLSLFQPDKNCGRLFDLFMTGVEARYQNKIDPGESKRPGLLRRFARLRGDSKPDRTPVTRATNATILRMLRLYGMGRFPRFSVAAIFGVGIATTVLLPDGFFWTAVGTLGAGVVCLLLIEIVWVIWGIADDLKNGLVKNELGLCRGKSVAYGKGPLQEGLTDWIHRGVQKGAGLNENGSPLTFQDLWGAPLWPGGPCGKGGKESKVSERSINLEMVTTNVTHSRPYSLPFFDDESRLFFDPEEWALYFPAPVMAHLRRVSFPYERRTHSDPDSPVGGQYLLEVPTGQLPVVVAARLSLSFPLLLSTVPLYALDDESDLTGERMLRLCRFSDGGLSSNFPVHFFDSAIPSWPTFGIWLQRRSPFRMNEPVCLPKHPGTGRGESWQRSRSMYDAAEAKYAADNVAEAAKAEAEEAAAIAIAKKNWNAELIRSDLPRVRSTQRTSISAIFTFLGTCLESAKDWNHQTAIRMPHVRHRVARIGLTTGEGELNLGMSSARILNMAGEYGTTAGKKLCAEFAPENAGDSPSPGWERHLWVRVHVLLAALEDLLTGFSRAATSSASTVPLQELIDKNSATGPRTEHGAGVPSLPDLQKSELEKIVGQLATLEESLRSRSALIDPLKPELEMRLRPKL